MDACARRKEEGKRRMRQQTRKNGILIRMWNSVDSFFFILFLRCFHLCAELLLFSSWLWLCECVCVARWRSTYPVSRLFSDLIRVFKCFDEIKNDSFCQKIATYNSHVQEGNERLHRMSHVRVCFSLLFHSFGQKKYMNKWWKFAFAWPAAPKMNIDTNIQIFLSF